MPKTPPKLRSPGSPQLPGSPQRLRRAGRLGGLGGRAGPDRAGGIELSHVDLVTIAMREAGFTEAKFDGELIRAAFQVRFSPTSSAKAAIWKPPWARRATSRWGGARTRAASWSRSAWSRCSARATFPIAFSVLGGDTASALASGNPVVVKADDSHPAISLLSCETLLVSRCLGLSRRRNRRRRR